MFCYGAYEMFARDNVNSVKVKKQQKGKLSLLSSAGREISGSIMAGWGGGWYVCQLQHGSNCLLVWAMDGRIIRCSRSAATSEIKSDGKGRFLYVDVLWPHISDMALCWPFNPH